MKRFLSIICSTAIFLVLVASLTLSSSNDFKDGTAGKSTVFEIASGESGTSIGNHLQSAGVIKDSALFIHLFTSNPKAQAIAPGSHLVESHLSSKRALAELLDPKRLQGVIQVREGQTLAQLVKVMAGSGQIDMSDRNISGISPTVKNSYGSWEGQLAPAIYSFPRGTKYRDAIGEMSQRFSTEISNLGLAHGVPGFSAYQNLIVSSMVQLEGDPNDFSKVARVIFNRLAIGMPLQLNSTVQYVLGNQSSITLSRQATQIQSPFNTYLHGGLPPTPIAFPSLKAISATLAPTQGDWLYFITVQPGDTRFTKSFKEFESWVTLFNVNVAKGLFR